MSRARASVENVFLVMTYAANVAAAEKTVRQFSKLGFQCRTVGGYDLTLEDWPAEKVGTWPSEKAGEQSRRPCPVHHFYENDI